MREFSQTVGQHFCQILAKIGFGRVLEGFDQMRPVFVVHAERIEPLDRHEFAALGAGTVGIGERHSANRADRQWQHLHQFATRFAKPDVAVDRFKSLPAYLTLWRIDKIKEIGKE
jgi:hypothetical protein